MSLSVPLTVRVGDHHVTREVQSLSFRREAVGGVRSIAFSLARPLSDLTGMDPLAKVTVYDGRTAEPVAQGRLADTGRSADSNGERWDCVAFGPAQQASDIAAPYIVVDRSVSDGWVEYDRVAAEPTMGAGARPGDASANPAPGLFAHFPSGVPVNTNTRVSRRYDRVMNAGQKLARVHATWVGGANSGGWSLEMLTGTAGSLTDVPKSAAMTTAGGFYSAIVATDFPNGRDTAGFRLIWTGGAATVTGDTTWACWQDVAIEAVRYTKAGVELAGTYNGNFLVSQVVEDLLGRRLGQFDGANAVVAGTSNFLTQMAYPEPVTPAEVLEDCMALEPAYRWTTTPDATGSGYGFRWELWPTTVRYEATLDDGGTFPLSTQDVYNQVSVWWKGVYEETLSIVRTRACPILDNAGIVRRARIDLGSELGTQAQAEQAGDAWLEDHNVPKNAGTLTVARPIRDVITGRMVQPWEIEPGELVRVRGVEAYPDAFNADTNDGQGVFRIHAVDYSSDGNTATLALDTDARDTADALVKLLKQRDRR